MNGIYSVLQGRAFEPDDEHYHEDAPAAVSDPRVDQLQAQITQMSVEAARREFQSFVEAADKDGNKLHPYANDVKTEMSVEIQANPSITWEKAYEAAVWKHPETRQKLIEAEQRKQSAGHRQRVNKAYGMNLPQGRSDTSAVNGSTGDLREDIQRSMRFHS